MQIVRVARSFAVLLAWAAVGSLSAKTVTVRQLSEALGEAAANHLSDKDTAHRIAAFELSERITEDRLAALQSRAPGSLTAATLEELMEQSAFLQPPEAERAKGGPPSATEQKRMFILTIDYIVDYLRRLPNLLCRESITRFDDSPLRNTTGTRPLGKLRSWDTITARATYSRGREAVSVQAVNGRPFKANQMPGFTTEGEFGNTLVSLIEPSAHTTVDWSHWEVLHNKRVAVFHYAVAAPDSRYKLSFGCEGTPVQSVTAGYQGFLFIDGESGSIVRITRRTAAIPTGFPIRQSDTAIEYGPASIGGNSYMLPIRSVTQTDSPVGCDEFNSRFRLHSLNATRFSDYQLFQAESKMIASTQPDSMPQSMPVPASSPAATSGPAVPQLPPETNPPEAGIQAVQSVFALPQPPPFHEEVRAAAENLLAPVAGGTTIKVAVRQVLVPVVVTDKEGHHITGLKKADFRVLEDGVEQTIASFASEPADAVVSAGSNATLTQSDPITAVNPRKSSPKPQAYVICLDTMHTSFANLVYARQALQRLFAQQQAGDSQYVLMALGRTMEIVQNTTSNPAQVLDALSKASFQKTLAQNQKGSSQSEISRYEADLQEVRGLCDAGDPTCPMRKEHLPADAQQLAEEEQFHTTRFLAELRSVVEQLAAGGGRRTLILISDGFLLAPAEVPFGLLAAYFPEFRSTLKTEQMQSSIEPIFRLASKSDVPVYTIHSRGLYTSPGLEASRGSGSATLVPQLAIGPPVLAAVQSVLNDFSRDEALTLSEIAAATGGTAFQNSNDLFAGLKRAFADGREYYMLAYVSGNETQDGKFRKIEVKLRDSKGVVSAKRGYWADSK